MPGSTGPTARVERHVAAFAAAVATGDWSGFAEHFTPGAEMHFVGVPVGPYVGRAAVAAAYEADPPSEPLALSGPVTRDGHDVVAPFRWVQSGGTGTMRLRFDDDGLVSRLEVGFDQPPTR